MRIIFLFLPFFLFNCSPPKSCEDQPLLKYHYPDHLLNNETIFTFEAISPKNEISTYTIKEYLTTENEDTFLISIFKNTFFKEVDSTIYLLKNGIREHQNSFRLRLGFMDEFIPESYERLGNPFCTNSNFKINKSYKLLIDSINFEEITELKIRHSGYTKRTYNDSIYDCITYEGTKSVYRKNDGKTFLEHHNGILNCYCEGIGDVYSEFKINEDSIWKTRLINIKIAKRK